MRKQFAATITRMLERNPKVVLLLGDIGVFAFKEAMERWPDRVLNVGVNEQAMVGMAAGLARAGFYPICHTIAPFLIERAFEQIKVDFGYQQLSGAFVSVGASYDYSTLGATHHCPGDVALMLTVPGARIHVPGHCGELDRLLDGAPEFGGPTYIRLSEDQNSGDMRAQAYLRPHGAQVGGTLVIAVGPALRLAPRVIIGTPLDRINGVSVLYLATVQPFPWLLVQEAKPNKVLILEPFYYGTLTHLVTDALHPDPVVVHSIGVPRRFVRGFGSRADLDKECGLTAENVALQLRMLVAA